MVEKGKVAIFRGVKKPMEFREYPLLDVGPDDILVKVRRANICGSDVHFWSGQGPGVNPDIPQVLGHEMMGHVYRKGANIKGDSLGRPLEEGDRICYSYFSPCGQCWSCMSGTAACLNRYRNWIGVSVEKPPHFHGAFGEYYYLRKGHWIYKVPDEVSDKVAAGVNCALSEMIYGLYKVGVTLGDTVAIQGTGGLGLFASAVAREMGAAKVIAIDLVAQRLALAREMGATDTLDISKTNAVERIARVKELSGIGGADVVVEVAGTPACLQEGSDMLRPGGRYLWIGNINLGQQGTIDPASFVRNCKKVEAVIVYEPWVIYRALDFLARLKDKYPFDKLISHEFPFSEINRALEMSASRAVTRASLVF